MTLCCWRPGSRGWNLTSRDCYRPSAHRPFPPRPSPFNPVPGTRGGEGRRAFRGATPCSEELLPADRRFPGRPGRFRFPLAPPPPPPAPFAVPRVWIAAPGSLLPYPGSLLLALSSLRCWGAVPRAHRAPGPRSAPCRPPPAPSASACARSAPRARSPRRGAGGCPGSGG